MTTSDRLVDRLSSDIDLDVNLAAISRHIQSCVRKYGRDRTFIKAAHPLDPAAIAAQGRNDDALEDAEVVAGVDTTPQFDVWGNPLDMWGNRI